MYTHNWAQGESAIIRAPQRGVEATVGTPFSQGGKHAQAEPIDNAEAAQNVNLHGPDGGELGLDLATQDLDAALFACGFSARSAEEPHMDKKGGALCRRLSVLNTQAQYTAPELGTLASAKVYPHVAEESRRPIDKASTACDNRKITTYSFSI